MRLLYKARGGWTVSCDFPCGQVLKYYGHIDCQNWANLAKESASVHTEHDRAPHTPSVSQDSLSCLVLTAYVHNLAMFHTAVLR